MRYNNNILYRDKLEANTHLLGLTVSPTLNGFLNSIDLHFFLFVRNSLHASITIAVDVVSLSNAYCFSCLTIDFGKSQVVLTFTSLLLAHLECVI